MCSEKRIYLLCVLCALCGLIYACKREERALRAPPPSTRRVEMTRVSSLVPGSSLPPPAAVSNQYEENAYAMSQGKQLFSAMNCVGCHAHGGGGMGPALMDNKWIYGSNPDQIFLTIIEGRPNGMPSFRGKLADYQVWQLVAYVRSMSGLTSKMAAPGRNDDMEGAPPENSRPKQTPKNSLIPPSAEMP